MLQSLADMLRRTLDQRIRIDGRRAAPDCPPVLADPGQLESALLNIAINARDAMPEAAASLVPCQPRAASADEPGAAALVAISIADTGSGMSEEVKRARVRAVLHDQGQAAAAPASA